jgi:hypothetical protein
MSKSVDRDKQYMYDMWGTTKLTSDYNCFDENVEKTMLREINHDEITPKKHNFIVQNEIHEKIRNDNDYDDWEYGTEPLPSRKWA